MPSAMIWLALLYGPQGPVANLKFNAEVDCKEFVYRTRAAALVEKQIVAGFCVGAANVIKEK